MDRDYRDALDELQFSPEAKRRLARAVAAAGAEGGSEDASGSARGAAGATRSWPPPRRRSPS